MDGSSRLSFVGCLGGARASRAGLLVGLVAVGRKGEDPGNDEVPVRPYGPSGLSTQHDPLGMTNKPGPCPHLPIKTNLMRWMPSSSLTSKAAAA